MRLRRNNLDEVRRGGDVFLVPAVVTALRLVLAAQTGWSAAPPLDSTKPYFSDYAYEQRDAARSMTKADVALAALEATPRMRFLLMF